MRKPQAKVLRNGRNANSRFVMLPHHLLKSPAWLTLSPASKALLLHLWPRFNGTNNGEIAYAVREAEQIGLTKDRASRALKELVARGFLVMTANSSFDVKSRLSRTWRITAEPTTTAKATMDFMRWRPGKPEIGSDTADGARGSSQNKTTVAPERQTVSPAIP